VDASLRIFKDDERPLYVQAADAVRARMADGSLRPGDRLPSVRRLSDELGVNPATVVAAYRILAREGLLESRQGSGAFVAAGGVLPPAEYPWRAEPGEDSGGTCLDLSANAPPRRLFPLADLKRFLAEAVDLDDGRAFEYQDAAGYGPLRERLAAGLSASVAPAGGRSASPDDVHIVSGAQQGLDLAARVLLRRGDTAAVECPGYLGARDVFLAAGARVVHLPMGDDGMDLDALEELALKSPLRLVHVNPDFQNPTGRRWSPASRERLASLASRHGFFVVEDDSLSDFVPPPLSIPPVRAFDRADRVLYVKSFSKSLMPGLRLGFLEAPAGFRDRIESSKRAVDLSSNGLMQRVLFLFLKSGRLAVHAEGLRARCAESLSGMDAALAPLRDLGWSWDRPLGGLNLWLALPPGMGGARFAAGARERGVLLAPEAWFNPDPARDGHLRLSCGGLAGPEIAVAASAILDAARAGPDGRGAAD